MKQRPSRKQNHIFEESERPPQQQLPLLSFNAPKAPQKNSQPSKAVRTTATQTTVQAGAETVGELLEIYEWRAQTDYPVVRASWKKVYFNQIAFSLNNKQQLLAFINQNAIRQNATIHVETEPTTPLQCFIPLPITQYLYTLRQALIAFERLFSLFGSYSVTPNMVAVNAQGKLKVWLHPQFHLNNKIEDCYLEAADTEGAIVEQVKRMLVGCALDGGTLRQFVEGAREIRSFIGCLKYIHDFSHNRKIIIATRIIKKQETPANHPKRPLSPVSHFRPPTRGGLLNKDFNAHFTMARPLNPPINYEPQLALVSRKSMKKPFHFQALQTKETLTPLRTKISTEFQTLSTQAAPQYGRIVKNRLNMWLVNSKSLQNLPRFSPTTSIQRCMQPSAPNSIQKNMNRLFEDEIMPSNQKLTKLMQLGRQVKASFIE